jgi:hypothetical protein
MLKSTPRGLKNGLGDNQHFRFFVLQGRLRIAQDEVLGSS